MCLWYKNRKILYFNVIMRILESNCLGFLRMLAATKLVLPKLPSWLMKSKLWEDQRRLLQNNRRTNCWHSPPEIANPQGASQTMLRGSANVASGLPAGQNAMSHHCCSQALRHPSIPSSSSDRNCPALSRSPTSEKSLPQPKKPRENPLVFSAAWSAFYSRE